MRPEFSDWDAAETIDNDDDARLFLEEFAKDGTAEEVAGAIRTVARAYGMRILAKRAGVTPRELFEAVGRYPAPDLAELLRILAALSISGEHSDAAE